MLDSNMFQNQWIILHQTSATPKELPQKDVTLQSILMQLVVSIGPSNS